MTLLLKEAKRFIPSTLIMTTQCVTRFVNRWNKWFASDDYAPPVPPHDAISLFELDVQEMFPSLDQDRVLASLQELHDLVLKARGKRGKCLLFAINRHDRKLDRMGTGYHRFFTNLSFPEVMTFCRFDVLKNDVFVVGSSVMRQKRGIAIGGTGSAQLANADLFVREHKFYPLTDPVALDDSGLHPGDLPVHPFRYVDNIVGAKRVSTPLASILDNFQSLYGLRLQEEGEGNMLTTLETTLSVGGTPSCPVIGMKYANKQDPYCHDGQQKYRFPERHKPGTRKAVRGIVPAAAKNCMYYRRTQEDIIHNVSHVADSFITKGYPARWWKPTLRHRLAQWGARRRALQLPET